MTQYIYQLQLLRPSILTDGPNKREEQILNDHVKYLSELADASRVLVAGRTQTSDENTFGIVIFTAESEREARELMNNDPAVQQQVMSARLYPFNIAIMARSPHCQ